MEEQGEKATKLEQAATTDKQETAGGSAKPPLPGRVGFSDKQVRELEDIAEGIEAAFLDALDTKWSLTLPGSKRNIEYHPSTGDILSTIYKLIEQVMFGEVPMAEMGRILVRRNEDGAAHIYIKAGEL